MAKEAGSRRPINQPTNHTTRTCVVVSIIYIYIYIYIISIFLASGHGGIDRTDRWTDGQRLRERAYSRVIIILLYYYTV